jgi:hypothetical protein
MRILFVSESGERLPMSQVSSRVLRPKCFLVFLHVLTSEALVEMEAKIFYRFCPWYVGLVDVYWWAGFLS